MRLLLLIFFMITSMSSYVFANEDGTYVNNDGYFKSRGFVGIYGTYTDYNKDYLEDNKISGGGFAYVNVVNTIYGNAMIGIGSVYEYTKLKKSTYTGLVDNTAIQLNIAYKTSSKMVNAWGGVGFTLNFYDVLFTSYKNGAMNLDVRKHQYEMLAGLDLFVGAEYLLTKNGLVGIFMEARYSFNENFVINTTLDETNADGTSIVLKEAISPFNLKIALGISLNF